MSLIVLLIEIPMSSMDMRRIVAVLAEEAEHQIHDQVWELAPSERALPRETEAGPRKVVGLPGPRSGCRSPAARPAAASQSRAPLPPAAARAGR